MYGHFAVCPFLAHGEVPYSGTRWLPLSCASPWHTTKTNFFLFFWFCFFLIFRHLKLQQLIQKPNIHKFNMNSHFNHEHCNDHQHFNNNSTINMNIDIDKFNMKSTYTSKSTFINSHRHRQVQLQLNIQ